MAINKETRQKVYEKYNGRCTYCGAFSVSHGADYCSNCGAIMTRTPKERGNE